MNEHVMRVCCAHSNPNDEIAMTLKTDTIPPPAPPVGDVVEPDAASRFEQSMLELRHAFANVKRYSAGFSDGDASELMRALEAAGPNDDGKQAA